MPQEAVEPSSRTAPGTPLLQRESIYRGSGFDHSLGARLLGFKSQLCLNSSSLQWSDKNGTYLLWYL